MSNIHFFLNGCFSALKTPTSRVVSCMVTSMWRYWLGWSLCGHRFPWYRMDFHHWLWRLRARSPCTWRSRDQSTWTIDAIWSEMDRCEISRFPWMAPWIWWFGPSESPIGFFCRGPAWAANFSKGLSGLHCFLLKHLGGGPSLLALCFVSSFWVVGGEIQRTNMTKMEGIQIWMQVGDESAQSR